MADWLKKVFGLGAESETDDILSSRKADTIDSVPFFKRPVATLGRNTVVGYTESGSPLYEGQMGGLFSVYPDPDQRTALTRNTETVQAFLEDPKMPTGQQVKDAAVGAAQAVADAVSLPGDILSGEKSLSEVSVGDVYGAAGVSAAGGIPFKKPDGSMGMFLIRSQKPEVQAAKKTAIQMEKDGSDRTDIWKETGWGRFNGEWVTEITDDKTEIQLTADTKNFPDIPGETVTTTTRKLQSNRGVNPAVRTAVAKRKIAELRTKYSNGEISEEEMLSGVDDLARYASESVSPTYVDVEETVSTPDRPDPRTQLSKRSSRLDEVLYHPDLFSEVPEVAKQSAQAGSRKSQKKNLHGDYTPMAYTPTDGIRINAYKDAGFFNDGPKSPAGPEGIKSTLLHEVQHAVDNLQGADTQAIPSSRAASLEAYIMRYGKSVEDEFGPDAVGPDSEDNLLRIYDYIKRFSNREAREFLVYSLGDGEMKSRTTQTRRDMDEKERREQPFWRSYDYPEGLMWNDRDRKVK